MKETLSGKWLLYTDKDNTGIDDKIYLQSNIDKNKSEFSEIEVPSCWNSLPKLERYEGYCWYFKIFEIQEFDDIENEFFIIFNGVNYYAKVWFNDKYLGAHSGGFLPFKFKINSQDLRKMGKNYLAVYVENIRKKSRIPGKIFDWYNWGGIHRDVYYEILPKSRFNWFHITTTLAKNYARLKCDYELTQIKEFEYEIKFKDEVIKKGHISPKTIKGTFYVNIKNPHIWAPETPNLHFLNLNFDNNKHIHVIRFGIREIQVKGPYLYLNRKRIKLFGVSLHEELVPFGRSIPVEERKRDLENIKNLGFNALRSAHYSHDESLLELADEIGLLILEEIPVYWNINFKNIQTLKLAIKMIHDLIFRDFNHPSVIFWSVGNEIPIESIYCRKFILTLIKYAKKLDSSRLVGYVSAHFLSDHYRKKTDIATLNEYFGWYLLSEKNLNAILEMTRGMSLCYNKPWFITEFGAGAKFGFRSVNYKKFSEDRQAQLISHSIKVFNSKPWIAGWFIWIYRDFKSAFRLNEYQKGFNRKGIVSEKNEPKLIAKLIPKGITKKIKTRSFKYFAILAFPIGYFFSYIFKLTDLLYFLQNKIMNKFYSNKPQ
ncbi:MAG: glycoside hydrolase family 2 protein [Candidatus Helarchaeota archaeon]